jgi:hypothetical protein
VIHANYEMSDSRVNSNSSFYKMKHKNVVNHKDILKRKGVKSRNKTYNHNNASNKDIYFPYLDASKTVDQYEKGGYKDRRIPYSHVSAVIKALYHN